MKRFGTLMLAMMMVISMFGVSVFGASISITAESNTVRVGETISIDFDSSESYDKVSWNVDNPHVLELDNGEAIGVMAGRATISVVLYSTETDSDGRTRTVRVGEASKNITVTGRTSQEISAAREASQASASAAAASSSRAAAAASSNTTKDVKGAVSSSELKSAIGTAISSGGTPRFQNYESISMGVLEAGAATMSDRSLLVHFDTMNGNSVGGRVTIAPKDAVNLAGEISLGLFSGSDQTGSVSKLFERYYRNDVVVVKAAQSGKYGLTVRMAVPGGGRFSSADQLVVYHYDAKNNVYQKLENAGASLDGNGYVHFATDCGDYLVISSGELLKV